MTINLTPFSQENFLEISVEDYERLIHINEKGWSYCNSKLEYMAKLHYLRSVFFQGKIEEAKQFKDKFDVIWQLSDIQLESSVI